MELFPVGRNKQVCAPFESTGYVKGIHIAAFLFYVPFCEQGGSKNVFTFPFLNDGRRKLCPLYGKTQSLFFPRWGLGLIRNRVDLGDCFPVSYNKNCFATLYI